MVNNAASQNFNIFVHRELLHLPIFHLNITK